MNKALFFAAICSIFLTSCGLKDVPPVIETASKPVIITSFFPITHIVEKIVGDQATVVQILPQGAEGHGYEPTPEQMKTIETSDLVIVLGTAMEGYADKLKNIMAEKNKSYLDFSETVITLASTEEEHHEEDGETHAQEETEERDEKDRYDHGGVDPHIWLSPRTYSMMADIISQKIVTTFPTLQVSENIQALKDDLKTLDQEYTLALKQCETRTFITSHAAFGYLARDYALKQVSIAGISPEEEPSAKTIVEIITLVKNENLKAVFSEPLVSQKLIDTIASETGATTYLLHPLESLNPSETSLEYVGIMRQNLAKLKSGLHCQ